MMIGSNAHNLTIDVNIQDVFTVDSSEIGDQLTIPSIPWQHWFQTWGKHLVADFPPSSGYELTLRLTGDAEIQCLNAQYRHKNQPTDVLAFATLAANFPTLDGETFQPEPLYLGDIVISVDTANQQAREQNHSLQRELAWLASHGFLHLLGWDHPDDKMLQVMLKQQETLLEIIGL